ncbi:MAG: pilus assembly protein [Granulosicoccus sp.]
MRNLLLTLFLMVTLLPASAHSQALNLAESPLFVSGGKTALVQLVVQRDNNLFFEAYPSYEDINSDGVLDIRYKPSEIDYVGYFYSYFCYTMSGGDHLVASAKTNDKTCSNSWSGDFLNYLTMTRMDIMLRALYGGNRSVDTASETRLRRAFVPWENHTWGVEYDSEAIDGFKISDYAPYDAPETGKRHLFATNNFKKNHIPYLRVRTNVTDRIWKWTDKERIQGDGWSTLDLPLEVRLCAPGFLEDFCQKYPNGNYKPVGILHEYGENDSMYFSLLTGSFENNLQGGVLRQPMSSFGQNEVDSDTGVFKTEGGIVSTLNAIQIPNDFVKISVQRDCGWLWDRAFENGKCRAWGNPVAEMMYEGMRYLGGEQEPSQEFHTTGGMDETLGLTTPDWDDPYSNDQPYAQCSSAYQLVISDPSPSFDGDQLPGSDFGNFTGSGLSGLHVGDIADFISSNDGSVPGLKFIGQVGNQADGAPSAKAVSTLRNIRGQAPEAPHRQGSYYASSVSYFGHQNDVHPDAPGDQTVGNFTLALGSPLPTIEVDVQGKTISFAPYSKTVKIGNRVLGEYQPTNAIVGFNVEYVNETSGSFRVSFEDNEQGADNDLDAVSRYSYTVVDDELIMTITSLDAAGGAVQHMGFAVSGSDKDGIYLVVRDSDTAEHKDTDFRLDVPPGQSPGVGWADGLPLPLSQVITFKAGTGSGAEQLPSPLWYAAKWGGFKDLNDDGIPQDAEWDADGDGNPDNYFPVVNPSKMIDTLRNVFDQISEEAGAANSIGVTGGALSTGSRIYQADFVSKQWTGDLKSYPIHHTGEIDTTADWSANDALAAQIATDSRQVLTYNPQEKSGVAFQWPNNILSLGETDLSASQVVSLSLDPVSKQIDLRGADRLAYLRGELVADFRRRSASLGDIVHSSPQLVGAPAYYYPNNWGSGAPENSSPYSEFAKQHRNRQRVVYVGANDGMLHAFDAGTANNGQYSAGSGRELFAYVPAAVFEELPELTHPRYTHKYYVDGTPRIGDAFDGSNWRTVLVGGLRRGGQGIYALDVTNPLSINESTAGSAVLWEFTDADDPDMGYSYSTPLIARMNNGRWAAIFSNGYGNRDADANQGSGSAAIFIVDLFTGDLMAKLNANAKVLDHNGMSEPTAVDLDGNNTVDFIYAGDLAGFVHGYDVTGNSAVKWKSDVKKSHVKVFRALDEDGNHQPITTAISVGSHPTGVGLMLYVGTGKYLEPSDQTDSSDVHRLYGLWDNPNNKSIANWTKPTQRLLKQSITGEKTASLDLDGDGQDDSTVEVRESTQHPIDWTSQRGWYIDLVYQTTQGEQIVANPVLRDGRLFVSTHIPSGDECNPHQDGWLMVFDPVTGSMLSDSPFDTDGDESYEGEEAITGIRNGGNPFAAPTFASASVDDVLLSHNESDPAVSSMSIDASLNNGRLSWRELEP